MERSHKGRTAGPDRLLSYRDVTRLYTVSESTIRSLIAEGKFPKPVRLTPGRVVFLPEKVSEAIARLLAENRGA